MGLLWLNYFNNIYNVIIVDFSDLNKVNVKLCRNQLDFFKPMNKIRILRYPKSIEKKYASVYKRSMDKCKKCSATPVTRLDQSYEDS